MQGDKVKCVMRFKGREMDYPELGIDMFNVSSIDLPRVSHYFISLPAITLFSRSPCSDSGLQAGEFAYMFHVLFAHTEKMGLCSVSRRIWERISPLLRTPSGKATR